MDWCFDILLSQSTAEDQMSTLRVSLLELHVLSAEEWPDLVKPKVHMGLHVPDQIRSHGSSTACWSNERRNMLLKKRRRTSGTSKTRTSLRSEIGCASIWHTGAKQTFNLYGRCLLNERAQPSTITGGLGGDREYK
jgi:hypothetical protein